MFCFCVFRVVDKKNTREYRIVAVFLFPWEYTTISAADNTSPRFHLTPHPATEFSMLLLFAVSKQEHDLINHTENINMYLFTLILSESPAPGNFQ